MSKLAKKPVKILEGVSIGFENDIITINGPKGNLSFKIPKGIEIKSQEGRIIVFLKEKNNQILKPSLGLTRAMISNMITGVTSGFEKRLELSGVGYRASVMGSDLVLSVGFSHPVKVMSIPGLTFAVNDNVITISGIDKDLVGRVSAKIRSIRPPEPYKGKGIKYVDEKIRRKVGKAAKALGVK